MSIDVLGVLWGSHCNTIFQTLYEFNGDNIGEVGNSCK